MSLYTRLSFFLEEHRPMLASEDPDAHLAVIARLRVVLDLEKGTAEAILQEAALSDIPCCECGARIPKHPDYQRLKLCTMCMCSGLFARCDFCGQNYPEHHPGGRGCAKWERREEPTPPDTLKKR